MIDLAAVILGGLVGVLAEIIVGIVERQPQVPGYRALAIVRIAGGPAGGELEQTGDFGAAVELGLDLSVG